MKKAPSPRSSLPADSLLAVPNPAKDSGPVSPSKPRSVESPPSSEVRRLSPPAHLMPNSALFLALRCRVFRCHSSEAL